MERLVSPTAWRLAASVHLVAVLTGLSWGMTLLLVPIYGLELGGLFSGFALPGMLALGSALVAVPGAMMVSRSGHRRVMLVGVCASCLASVGLGAFTGWLATAGSALLFGLGLGVFGLARLTYLSDAIPIASRGRVVATVGGMHRVGMLLGPLCGGYVADRFGREAAFGVSAAASLVAGVAVALWLQPVATVPAAERHPPLRMIARVLDEHRRSFLTAGLSMFALSLVRNGRLLLIPICGTLLGLDSAETGLVKSLSGAADMLLFYPAGLVMDRMGRKWTALPCLLVLSAGVLMIGIADSYSLLLWGGIVAGIGNGLGSGINMTLAGDLAPRAGRADFIGVWRLTSDTGSALAPFIMGAVAQTLAVGAAAALSAAIGVMGALLIGFGLRETLERGVARGGSLAPAAEPREGPAGGDR